MFPFFAELEVQDRPVIIRFIGEDDAKLFTNSVNNVFWKLALCSEEVESMYEDMDHLRIIIEHVNEQIKN